MRAGAKENEQRMNMWKQRARPQQASGHRSSAAQRANKHSTHKGDDAQHKRGNWMDGRTRELMRCSLGTFLSLRNLAMRGQNLHYRIDNQHTLVADRKPRRMRQ
jgi:hypothetical protein